MRRTIITFAVLAGLATPASAGAAASWSAKPIHGKAHTASYQRPHRGFCPSVCYGPIVVFAA